MGMFTVAIDSRGRRVQFKEAQGNDWCDEYKIGDSTSLNDGIFTGEYERTIVDCLIVVKNHVLVEVTDDVEGAYANLKAKYGF